MHTIENEFLIVEVSEIGAELRSVFDKKLNKERMWSGNPDVWGRVSPVLFPIVGKVKDGYYIFEGNKYELSQHGFLRDQKFNLKSQSKDSLVFTYKSSDEFLTIYPFKYEVEIEYKLQASALKVIWTIKNLKNSDMYYSIGAHPGFSLDESKDYEFIFPNEDSTNRYGIKNGLLGDSLPIELETINIKAETFVEDAIIYDHVSAVILQAKDKSESLRMNFSGFPLLGLWTVYDPSGRVPFVCIEPWHGIVDRYDSDHDFTKKLGSRHLNALESESLEYEMIFNER